jgi:hypothetical protein
VLVGVALAYLGSLRDGLLVDARFLIAENRYLDSFARWRDTLTHDYFWSSGGGTIPYWRPFTKLSWLVEARLFDRAPWVFHAAQLVWLLAAVAGVATVARRLGASSSWAAAAALLFGLHPALVEPGCLIMARSDLVVLAAMLWTIVAWHRWWADRRATMAIAHGLAVIVALGSKEIAIVLPVVLTAWWWMLGRGRVFTLTPAWLLTAVYLGLRARVVGSIPVEVLDPLRPFVSLGVYGAGLLPFRVATSVHNVSIAEAHAVTTLAISATAWIAIALGAAMALRRQSASAIVLLLLGLASLMPVILGPTPHVPGITGKFALADRWLITAAACACVGMALAVQAAAPRLQRVIISALLLWSVASLAISPVTHGYYASDATLLDLEEQVYEDTPARYRTAEDECRAGDRHVAAAIARNDVTQALALAQARSVADHGCAGGDSRFNLASILTRAGRYAEARTIAEDLYARFALEARFHAPLEFILGLCRLRTGDAVRAEPLFIAAQREGLTTCAIFAHLVECAESRGDAAMVDTRRGELARCVGH